MIVANVIGVYQGMGGVRMDCLRRRKECNVLLFDFVLWVGKTIVTRGNNAFATDEAGLVKSLAD